MSSSSGRGGASRSVTVINGKKTFTVLENNPEVMDALAAKLGLSPALKFYDVYSLTDQNLLQCIPRPVYALLVILPLTPAWEARRNATDMAREPYKKAGPDEPVLWFKQTIGNACGSIGLLHCLLNGQAREYILPDTILSRLLVEAMLLHPEKRANLLYNDKSFEEAHQSVAALGDTLPPSLAEGEHLGQHFVAFVKGNDGYLWELEGSRPGPIRRGKLEEGEDLLSENAIRQSIGGVIDLDRKAGGSDMRFSCIALAKDPAVSVSLPPSVYHPHDGYSHGGDGRSWRGIWDPAYVFEKWSPPKQRRSN
ncbi:hypothetical protein SBOR_8036 [Sclerotinia borealis F-4128]|uniref:Ubiquitin carboxyl-terminal hydrolase n=1 Tax=Sclerotinia borealis (strain F-4128) TaxID=1432307 RepID=W9C6T2_SCLBF|nr:hypothetical protein SBOR_8036 [Sclerotinia borealis F-4128]